MKRIPPWLSGLVSTLQAVGQVQATNIFCRRRLALILLDTVFETACHVYIRHVARWKPKQVAEVSGLGMRHQLFSAVGEHARSSGRTVDDVTWSLIDECHDLRNGLAHERPNEDVAAVHIKDYYEAALKFLNTLFEIDLEQAVTMLQMATLIPTDVTESSQRGLDQAQMRGLVLAMQEYYAGQLDAAIARLSQLLATRDTAEAHYLLALCNKRKGRVHWDAATREIELATAAIPDDAAIQLERADLLGRSNRPLDSLAAIDVAEKLGIDNIQTLQAVLLKARALRGRCRFSESLTCYEQAHELAQRYATARYAVDGLIEVLINLGRFDQAMILVNSLIKREPRYSYAFLLRARVHAETGDTDAAYTDLDNAWSLSTGKGGIGDNRVLYTRAALHLGCYYRQNSDGDLSRAENLLLEALPIITPGFRPRFRNLLVHVYWHQERHDDAHQQASLSVDENCFEERNHQYLAFAALSLYRWREAREAATRGLDLAGQLVAPGVLCGAAGLIASVFCEPTEALRVEHQRWVALIRSEKGFSAKEFRWAPVQARIRAALSGTGEAERSIVNDVLDGLGP